MQLYAAAMHTIKSNDEYTNAKAMCAVKDTKRILSPLEKCALKHTSKLIQRKANKGKEEKRN